MRAASRLGRAATLAATIAFATTVARAQETPAPATNTPSNETVGPRELQNFSLEGTRTTPAPTTPAPTPAPTQRASPAPAQRSASPATSDSSSPRVQGPPTTPERPSIEARSAPRPEVLPAPISSTDVPSFDSSMTGVPAPADRPRQFDRPASTAAQPDEAWPILPWLAVLVAALGAGAFLLLRKRQALQLASGQDFDEEYPAPVEPFTPAARPAPEPKAATTSTGHVLARQTRPTPGPELERGAIGQVLAREVAPKVSSGLISARLRPSLEIGFEPVRCIMDDELFTIQFRIDLFNSGNAPARAVLAEANVFNAGSEQDQQIAAFFANPVGQGERIELIAPLKRIVLTSQIAARRDQLQQFEVAGRKLAVPIIAFNALYSWAGGAGQTSVAYLLGRQGTAEKMAPFRLEGGSRSFSDLEARLLPIELRH